MASEAMGDCGSGPRSMIASGQSPGRRHRSTDSICVQRPLITVKPWGPRRRREKRHMPLLGLFASLTLESTSFRRLFCSLIAIPDHLGHQAETQVCYGYRSARRRLAGGLVMLQGSGHFDLLVDVL